MKLPRVFRRSISARLFLFTILPLLLITGLLTWHTMISLHAEMQHTLEDTAAQTAEYLANISDFPLYAGRTDQLSSLARSTGKLSAIGGVAFLNQSRTPLTTWGLPDYLTADALKKGDYPRQSARYLLVERPVYMKGTDVTDYAEEPKDSRTLLGWVVVAVDKLPLEKRLHSTLLTHLSISGLVLLAAMLLTWYLGRTLVTPLKAVTRTVRKLQTGDLMARAESDTEDELATLADGINHLAHSVAEGREEMEARVQLATRKLQSTLDDLQQKNKELEIARQEAEAGNMAKTNFLAQMSHELRTPVTAIQGFVNLLRNTKNLSIAEKRYCLIIQQASLQLLQLIDDILDTTRFQTHGIVIESAPFNVAECIETPIILMAPSAHSKGLELILDIAPDVPLGLEGDAQRIRQIVYNLVANAIKFTQQGSIAVKIRRIADREGNLILHIAVSDTGIGIPEKNRRQIFEAFVQADTSVSRRFGGSGLGLSIVRNLVSLMGGSIHIDSTAGLGSTFNLEIPLLQSFRQPKNPASSYRQVLLYDSHPRSREALEHLLARFVDNIDSCESLSDMDFSRTTTTPDLVVFAIEVGESEDNVRLTLQHIRRLFAAPVIAISPLQGFQASLDPARVDESQPILVIDKPASIQELTAALSGDEKDRSEASLEPPEMVNGHVLVAEDNEFMRLLLKTFLERCGCRCSEVQNGRDAITACQRRSFDLLLMDVHMPEFSGIDALRAIRREEGPNARVPVIMLTADILQQEENALFDAGANELMFKPIDEAKLHKFLEYYISKPLEVETPPPAAERLPVSREAFAAEIRRLTDEAQLALDRNDAATLRETLHQLLGVAGIFRKSYLERAVRGLHAAVKKSDDDIIAASMETLQLEVAKLEDSRDTRESSGRH